MEEQKRYTMSALGQQARQNSNSGGIAVGSSLSNEIPTEMVELRELVARLTSEVRELSARLNSVVEDVEHTTPPTAKRETPRTPLGRDLRDLTNQLYEVSEQVRRVTVALGV
jgi:hypothetical protein